MFEAMDDDTHSFEPLILLGIVCCHVIHTVQIAPEFSYEIFRIQFYLSDG